MMKMILIIASAVSFVIGLEPPPQWLLNMPAGTPQVIYWPGMWRPEQPWGQFRLGYWPKDSFTVSWIIYDSEPEIGYPYHCGTVLGLNDTVKVRLYFDNRSSADFCMANQTPETWFYPVLYDPAADVLTNNPLADTSVFSYRFEHWINMLDNVIADKPDTIICPGWHKIVYPWGMICSIWGVSPGTYRVVLVSTSVKPDNVKLTLDNPNNVFTMTTSQHVLDSVNAYCYIASNALLRREFTLFNTYVDSVFYLNPQSIPGWALRYSGYEAQADTVNAIAAIDSLLFIGNNNLDPFVPDSSQRTEFHNLWLQDYLHNYPFAKWRLLYPETKYIVFE
jgi:hypothetical protein